MPNGFHYHRPRLAMLCLMLAPWAGVRAAEPIVMQVDGAPDPLTGALTDVRPGLGGAQVDFGYVSNMGPQPLTGSRIDGDGGNARYIATLDVVVTRTADDAFQVQTFRPELGLFDVSTATTVDMLGPSTRVQGLGGSSAAPQYRSAQNAPPDTFMQRPGTVSGRDRGGYYVPPASQSDAYESVQMVDLYVRLMGQEGNKTTVWFSGPGAPIGMDGSAIEVSFMDVLVATSVPVGQPFRCQIALDVPASEWGHQSANIVFSARRSGL